MEPRRTRIEVGLAVGRYRIERRLGAGSMGEVYIGVDDALGRRAALKFLGENQLDRANVRERFLREARALAQLNHPNLITVFEAGEHEGRPYFAMELLEGGDTMQLLQEHGQLTDGMAASIGAQAAHGLAEAARAGITHRDVKPTNLGINARGSVKVTDFGLAKSEQVDKSLTGKGLVVGTADYISPEQARGDVLDERADVYSLGCSLFHLLAGRPPYRRNEDGTQRYLDVIRDHLQAPIPDLPAFAPGVDADLAAIVRRTMSKDREERPRLAELARDLDRVVLRLGGGIPRLSKRSFAVVTEPPTDPRPHGIHRLTPRPIGGVARLPGASHSDTSVDGVSSATLPGVEARRRRADRRMLYVALIAGLAGAGAVYLLIRL